MYRAQKEVTVPIIGEAESLIQLEDSRLNEHVFKVLSNQKTNKYLK